MRTDTLTASRNVAIWGSTDLTGLSVGGNLKAVASGFAVATTLFAGTGTSHKTPVPPYQNLTAAHQSLGMLKDTDRVTIVGNASFSGDHRGALTAGILFLRGNFTQGSNIWSFTPDKAHQVVLNGTAPQTVTFADTMGYSYFQRLKIANKTGVTLSASTRVRHTMDVVGKATVPSEGSLKVIGYWYNASGVQVYQKATLNLGAGSVLNHQGTTRAELLNIDPTATVNGNPVTR